MVVVVTGGSRGLGRATVLAALREGHDVAFTFVRQEDEAKRTLALAADLAPDSTCRAYQLDVRDSTAVDDFGDAVCDDFEVVNAVVCNAAVNRDGLAVSMDDEAWQEVIDTNLSGSFFVVRRFLPELLAEGGGRVVLVGSVADRGLVGMANYCASKAGLLGLGRALAKEYGPKGVTTNVVVPGFFDTDMTRRHLPKATREAWGRHCPARRMGDGEELAAVVLFLISEAASFVNGQALGVNGGLDEVL